MNEPRPHWEEVPKTTGGQMPVGVSSAPGMKPYEIPQATVEFHTTSVPAVLPPQCGSTLRVNPFPTTDSQRVRSYVTALKAHIAMMERELDAMKVTLANLVDGL
jgi:hypothetical protein